MAKDTKAEDWQSGLYDPGEGTDCPRAWFIGCDQYGRTRYRLDETYHDGGDPMDMTKYNGCNGPCWNYAVCCIGGLCIGSGVYTGKQANRIRKKYNIPGNYQDDIVKGIFCQPCSLIRSEVEMRRREGQNHKLDGLTPPAPLGESFEPMTYLLSRGDNMPYRSEPNMTPSNTGQSKPGPGRREVHFHNDTGGPRMVPLYPTEEELQDTSNLGQLPNIPHVASPLSIDALGRRSQALTPISERDSAEDPRSHLKENNPRYPQVQNWLQSTGLSPGDKPTAEKSVVTSGPGNPPTMISQAGNASPEPTSSPKPKKKSPFKSLKRSDKKKKIAAPEAGPEQQPGPQLVTFANAPEIVVTPSPEPSGGGMEHGPTVSGPKGEIASPRPVHNLSADILVPGAFVTDLEHNIQDDVRVASPKSTDLAEHDLADDKKVEFLELTSPEHNLSIDKKVESPEPSNKEHRISKDKQVTVDEPPLHEHSLNTDQMVSVPDENFTWLEQPEQEHNLAGDLRVEVSSPPPREHDLGSDIQVPAPQGLQAYDHRLSKDKRVQSPAPRGPFIHGIRLDERVPNPELQWTSLEHNILQDRQILSPSPVVEEHDLHADERVKSPALFPAREHDIQSDEQVAGPPGSARQHGLQDDKKFAASSQKNPKDHSLSNDNKVAQRAYQLLEHFLEQDRKAPSRSDKSR